MPQQTKARWAELRVGIMAIIALSLLGYLVFLLTGAGGFFERTSNVFTYMTDSSDLAEGAPVRLNGIVVGKVNKVALSGSNDPGRIIKIEMEIEDKFFPAIPDDSVAAIAAGNLLGTKYINITKGSSGQIVQKNGELKSASTAELTELFQQGNNALAALQDIIKKVDQLLTEVLSGQGTIGKLLVDSTLADKAVGLENEAQKLLSALNSNKGTIPKWLNDDTMDTEVRGTLGRINTLMDGLQQGQGTLGKILKDPAMYDDAQASIKDLRKAMASIQKLIDGINAGEGTAGKLLKSDELHNELKTSLERTNALLDTINNGQGTIGMLMNNPSLYESLDGTAQELHGLMKDFRSNPKKFLTIKLVLF
jgi:phospholipid/cholesterol/gamma-HCH transport system substrate-binding protein